MSTGLQSGIFAGTKLLYSGRILHAFIPARSSIFDPHLSEYILQGAFKVSEGSTSVSAT